MPPLKNYPPIHIAEMVYNIVFLLISLSQKDRVHATVSPWTLSELAIDYHKHCKVAFVTYVQVYEECDNSLSPITAGAIVL